MSDFVSDTWHYYVVGLVVLSLAFCLWILVSNMTKREKGPVTLHDHIWDETLQEYNHPLPRWWLYLFWLTLGFAVAYLVLYPGLGTRQGQLGWSGKSQYEAEVKAAEAQFKPIYAKYAKQDLAAVAADPEAQAMGQRLFLTYCAQCHGADAHGAKGFPNLADNDWLYGGDPATIKTTITGGRNGAMPAWGAVLGADGVKDAANYVRSLSGLANDSIRAQRGKELYAQNCIACHGLEGKGNQALGAPNLTDRIWLWGSSETSLIETISKGRQNQMPVFKDFLGEDKIHILSAYVLSLSKSQDKQQ
ncbi:cytochrome-c oxidase, cbb3-type subunit III [Uliginosibacterium sp. 31-16]|uniref:cytochrome-c oxidase, cbb3-type subunit III n=1 Tax=Uliginosibacterium sp. 31-16 TaxID=3068315 RepID=UPI00273E2C99|nr:cytochrome-c oxidase, cbb3-type subunit III [Uliginosibacterium sp. 31-16]MDP5240128.1 cytochrome-c oxidase, cbb3-type subunit III [Uliginosibacterium sp. 31-16]